MALTRRQIGLKVTHRRCPGCDNIYCQNELALIENNPLCIICKKHKVSEFIAVGIDTWKPKVQV